MSALGQKRTFAAYAPLSIATAKADTEADAPPEQGEVVWTADRTPKYAGLLCTTCREFCLQSHSLRQLLTCGRLPPFRETKIFAIFVCREIISQKSACYLASSAARSSAIMRLQVGRCDSSASRIRKKAFFFSATAALL